MPFLLKKLLVFYLGAKTALPIFKDFIKKAVKKKDARPFKVAKNITMMVIDPVNGKKVNFGSKETVIEAFKKNNLNLKNHQFKDINDRLKNNNILKFY